MRYLILALLAAGALLSASPSYAQATRTWVSGVGDDANPCSRTAPCKTFAGAISKTATGGAINCLDPGGFGGVTITKAIDITCTGVEGGVLVSGTNAIVVNLPNATDHVLIEGLDIDGVGTGLCGVKIIGAGRVVIRKTSIRRFTQNGVEMEGVAGSPAPRVLIVDSFITGNSGGVNVQGAGGATNNGEILNSVIDDNTTFNLQVNAGATVIISGSTLTGSPTNMVLNGGGQIISYGNNTLRNAGLPSSTTPLQ